MDIETIAPLVALGSFVVFVVADFVRPARAFTRVRWWRAKGLLFFILSMAVGGVLPFVWGDFVTKHALLHLSGLGTVLGAAVGYVAFQLVVYWWHRLQHTVPFIWRWSHQVHHSAERVDIWGVGLFHPFDMIAYAVLSSGVLSLVLGLPPAAVALAGGYGLYASIFQHANVRTPRWLGYLIQRPEAHGVHHQRGVHAYNYADLPIWDIVFGTFRNPKTWQAEGGFYDGASKRMGAMLLGRDITTPETNPMAARPMIAEPARSAA
jgi:sterol desaturase/sphingolipid hydroxylase (fatty acid hydroxylase superfamily)